MLVFVVVGCQFAGIVLMIVGTVLAAMLMVMSSRVRSVRMLVGMGVLVLMAVLMCVLVRVGDAIVGVLVGVSMLVRVFVLMCMFVFPLHSSPQAMLSPIAAL